MKLYPNFSPFFSEADTNTNINTKANSSGTVNSWHLLKTKSFCFQSTFSKEESQSGSPMVTHSRIEDEVLVPSCTPGPTCTSVCVAVGGIIVLATVSQPTTDVQETIAKSDC